MATDGTAFLLPLRRLGRTDIEVPAIGIGCWPIGGPDNNLGLPMGWSSGADAEASLRGLEAAYGLGADCSIRQTYTVTAPPSGFWAGSWLRWIGRRSC